MSEETLKQHVAAMERGARCAICPLYGCGQGPVMPEVRLGALLTIIGEAPHTTEVEEGRTFAGATSEVLTATLPEVGVARQDCTYTNAILCRPPGGHMLDFAAELNKKHKKAVAKARAERVEPPPLITPQECCAPRLERDIADSESRVLLALGSEGLKAAAHAMKLPYAGQKAAPGTARVTSVKKQHGSPVLAPDGRVLMSSLHPVFAGYGNNAKFMPVIREDLKRAGRIAKRDAVIDWYEPEFIIKPSHDTCINVMERMLRARALVTVDIETDGKDPNTCGIRCVGLGAVIDGQEVVIVIPLRHMDGRRWWSPADEQRIENALRELLEANPLAGQNLLFDTCVLLRLKLLITRGKRWFDTMLAHHNTSQSELPHDLGFIAARNFEAPRWKEDADAKSIDGVDDYWLHLYCMFRGTPVVMADGSTRLIEDLVREKSTAEVLALQNGRLVARRITGWHKQEVVGQKWLNLRIERQRASERGIVCTPEHKVLVSKYAEGQARWTPARFVRPGDFVRLPQARLYEQSRDLIIGTLLGDTSLQFSPRFRGRELEAPEASVQGGHALDSELAQMKRELLPDLFTGSQLLPGREVSIDGRSGTAGPFLGIWSKQHRELAELYPLLYDTQGRRRLRAEVLDALNLGAIAWWFMDDGCRQAGQERCANTGARGGRSHDPDSVVFSTQRYPKEDVEAAAAWFTRRFGKTYACGDGTLRLSYKASARFAQEIAPYVFPAQRYKLPHGEWPEFDQRQYVGRAFIEHAVVARVATVEEFIPTPAMHARGDAKTRYCLDVKDARSFFTPWGLVHNCSKDVLGEMRLVDPLARQVNEEGTALALKTDTILAPTARDMGVLGLNIDEDRRRKFFDILDAKVTDQATKLKLITGNPDFNPNAFKQVADFLYIKKGLSPPYATDGREWEELEDDEELEIDTDDPEVILAKAATNELALLRLLELGVDEQTRQFIEGELFYRGLQKCKSTYVGLKAEDENGARVIVDTHRKKGYLQTEFWLGKRHSILHPSWKLHITPTGRWATSPNVQNWPERIVFDIELYKATERIRAAEMAEFGKPKTPEAGILNTRAMVVAPDEHILVGADYAAIELRLYAAMSGDALLLDAILHGKDPHALNYATMQSRHPGDLMKWYDRVMTSSPTVKKYLRIIAKRFGFLVIYGGQKDKLYRTMASDRNPDGTRSFPDLKPADVEMWFDNWHRMHPETKRWHEAVVRAWSRHGFVATILDGRRRFFLGGMDMTAMPNMTIQGSAASIANRAMIRVAEQCPHRGWSDLSGPVLQVHDFIGLQVPLKRQKEAEQLLMREMPYEYNGMKYEVEQKSGLSWDKT